MDDRTWYLAITSLVFAFVAMVVDAVLSSFDVPAGYWAVLSAVLTFLGARSAFRRAKERVEDE